MRDVPDDGERDTNPSNEQPTTVNRQQDTPPAGYEIQDDDQPTEAHTVESSIPPPPPPPPPPPGYDEQPTEVGREAYGDETQVGRTVSDETQAGQTMEADTQVGDRAKTRTSAQDDRAAAPQAAVRSEPAPPSGDEEDEYRWHTERTARSETAEKDAVEFIDVKKSFGRNTILNGLNLGIPDDQISMILGPSGTGKSVCIKHMVGLLYPDEGDVLVHGESVPNMADDELFEMRKKFGVLFQDGALFGSMNLWDNVAFPLR